MRVCAVRGENLASLEEPFEVALDEGALARAGLFTITGPTGAGKSTILDAICLALYDSVPRLARVKKKSLSIEDGVGERAGENALDPKSIMRRGAGTCFAEVDFVGVDGERYRSRWEARRARGNPCGALQPQKMTLINLSTKGALGGKKTETLGAIQEKVGLTFEEFTRSVLLAQGDFAAFLAADANERAVLLERMTGGEIYTALSMAAFERMKLENSRLEKLKEKAGQLEPMTEEERSAAEGTLAGLKAAGLEVKDELASVQRAASFYEVLATLEEAKAQGESRLDECKVSWDASKVRREQLEKGKVAFELQEALKRLGEQEREVRKEQEGEKALRLKVEDAGRLQGLKKAALDRVAVELWRALSQADALAVEAGNLVKKRPYLEEISRGWPVHRKGLESLIKSREVLKNELAGVGGEVLGGDTEGAAISAKLVEVALVDAEKDLKKAEQIRSLDEHRRELEDGTPCPLCGSLEHPWRRGDPDVSEVECLRRRAEKLAFAHRRITESTIAIRQEEERLAGPMELVPGWPRELAEKPSEFIKRIDEQLAEFVDAKGAVELQARLSERAGDLAIEIAEKGDEVNGDFGRSVGPKDAEGLIGEFAGKRAELERYKGEVEKLEAELSSVKKILVNKTEYLERLRKSLSESLDERGVSLEEVNCRLAKGRKWFDEEKRAIEAEKAALDRARTVLEERGRALEEHRGGSTPEYSKEEVASRKPFLEKRLEDLRERYQEVKRLLVQDEDVAKNAAEVGKRVIAQEERTLLWQRMSGLIGSSDGKKLRRLAQSITLEMLVHQANGHLAELARRYKLERIPGQDLELRIIDLDMAGELRSVGSLSGGETFLVSLALALGLSSLSSRKMLLETLFIDEGFGTLDDESLDAALAVLEGLRSTGRQVGVISHVRGLSEAVPVGVRLRKVGPGKSVVEAS